MSSELNQDCLLHGNLDITVKNTQNLPPKHGKIYIVVKLSDDTIARSPSLTTNDSEAPWFDHVKVPVASSGTHIHFILIREYVFEGRNIVGNLEIPAVLLKDEKKIEGSYHLSLAKDEISNWDNLPLFHILLLYTPVEEIDLDICRGLKGPNFPPTTVGAVTLYHGANKECSRDIYDALIDSRILIFISGFSLDLSVKLDRGDPNGSQSTLGELLKTKSQEGVEVVLALFNDMEASMYFEDSSVLVVNRWFHLDERDFGPNQRSMIVDVEANGKRTLSAFLGGSELYHVRFNFEPTDMFPRGPWCDWDCRIDGPAACDILNHLDERHSININKDLLNLMESSTIKEDDPEAWIIQDFSSTSLGRLDHSKASKRGIHEAYVTTIRAAKYFIYFEWPYSFRYMSEDGEANLIAKEIALKVANKIRSNERFAAYIIIPMWPADFAGAFHSNNNYNTIKMMYEIINKALEETGLNKKYKPQNFLNFFCLVNSESKSSTRSPWSSLYSRLRALIADDEYMLLGSACIKEESNFRDFIIGTSQPRKRWANRHEGSRGQIHRYRMSLWMKHTGTYDDDFERPETISCMERLRKVGEESWKSYTSSEITTMRSHLISYPIQVDAMGNVAPILGYENFREVDLELTKTYSEFSFASLDMGCLLHGDLNITVRNVKNLPPGKNYYIVVKLSNAKIACSPFFISDDSKTTWFDHLNVPVANNCGHIDFILRNIDENGEKRNIGIVQIPAVQIKLTGKIEESYPLKLTQGEGSGEGTSSSSELSDEPELHASLNFTPINEMESDISTGVQGTYFPCRRGGALTLYQDAHVCENLSQLVGGTLMHEQTPCWRDIYDAISNARHLIYITGWSLHHSVQLVRDDANVIDSNLGSLLRAKSEQNVKVLVLLWKDKSGKMNTGHMETFQFFKGTNVKVVLCARDAQREDEQEMGWFQSWYQWLKIQVESLLNHNMARGFNYSHHQKCVVVDVELGEKRSISAFLGGLDLCVGRYDTPQHSLFTTLETMHRDDYYNPLFENKKELRGPREPWHDLHCSFVGPAAFDVLKNFEQRWRKSSEHPLLDTNEVHLDTTESRTDDEAWGIQIFRSIDSNSVQGFDGSVQGLVTEKGKIIDKGIHRAYVRAIRAAKRFIYIENQYFIGSSSDWNEFKDAGADNLIPVEIAQKIASKIRAKERFAVYIIIPMWPESSARALATPNILFCQHQTMNMMYKIIHRALEDTGLDKKYKPQDFLNFFCLGKREVDAPESSAPESVVRGPNCFDFFRPRIQALKQSTENRRFMIYVHSKGMIVDDEYVLIGSANINQRSLDGSRDTEIAMGASQSRDGHEVTRGQIHKYRISLWMEHTGIYDDAFKQPELIECMRLLTRIGEENGRIYKSDEVTEMKSHLISYPIQIDEEGNVVPIPGNEYFPDVDIRLTGNLNLGRLAKKLFT